MHKIGKARVFLVRLLGLLLKLTITLVGNVLKPQAESVLIPLELTASPKVTDATIQKKMFKFCTAT